MSSFRDKEPLLVSKRRDASVTRPCPVKSLHCYSSRFIFETSETKCQNILVDAAVGVEALQQKPRQPNRLRQHRQSLQIRFMRATTKPLLWYMKNCASRTILLAKIRIYPNYGHLNTPHLLCDAHDILSSTEVSYL